MENLSTEDHNVVIARWLGYKYNTKVLIDDSDCGGLYEWQEVWSKIPILVDDYPDENDHRYDQRYLKKEWYDVAKYGVYFYGPPNYNLDWENMMENVVSRIERIGGTSVTITGNLCIIKPIIYDIKKDCMVFHPEIRSMSNTKLGAIASAVVAFIQWHESFINKQNNQK